MWTGCWNALIWTWFSTRQILQLLQQSWPSVVSWRWESLSTVSPGRNENWKHNLISLFLPWKSYLNVSSATGFYLAVKKKETWASFQIQPLKDCLLLKPFYVESLEVIKNLVNFWSFLLRNKLPCFLKHKKKKWFHICHSKLENLKERVNFPKMLDVMPFISIKLSFKVTALDFVVQLCVS